MRDLEIRDIEQLHDFVVENSVKIIIIATPKEHAQGVVDKVADTDIKGIWNFAPVDLAVPKSIIVENAHLSDSLFVLSYMINEPELFKR